MDCKCKPFLYLCWLWYVTKSIYAEFDVHKLSPMPYSYYYFSESKTNYDEAFENCILSQDLQLELVSIFDENIYEQLHRALLTQPLWHQFVGPANGLYTTATTSIPGAKGNFSWLTGNITYVLSENISSRLWAPGQPDNLSGNESCTVIYLLSLKNPMLVMEDVDCSIKHGFICHEPRFEAMNCTEVDHHNFSTDLRVGLTMVDWSTAFECCVNLGLTLPVLQTAEVQKILSDRIWGSGIPALPSELNLTQVWTYAYKVWDVFNKDEYYQPYLRNYRWPDHTWFRVHRHSKKHCLSFKSEYGDQKLITEYCYKRLPYICVPKQKPLPCDQIPFEDVTTMKGLYYSNHTIVTWNEATECCESRNQKLLLINETVGNTLAAYFRSNKMTAMRHEGLNYGIWTSNDPDDFESVNFVPVDSRQIALRQGRSWNSTGPNGGMCLQYVVTGGKSFILHDIKCHLQRSFICVDTASSWWIKTEWNHSNYWNNSNYQNNSNSWNDSDSNTTPEPIVTTTIPTPTIPPVPIDTTTIGTPTTKVPPIPINHRDVTDYFIVKGKNATHWYAARKACQKEKAELAYIRDETEMEVVKQVINNDRGNSLKEFTSPATGLYTGAVGAQPFEKNGFQWNIEGKQYLMRDFPVHLELWAPGQPDNANPLEQCTVFYFPGPGEGQPLVMADLQCREKRGYICARITHIEGRHSRRGKFMKGIKKPAVARYE